VRAATAGGLPPTFLAAPFTLTDFHKVTVDDVISANCLLPNMSSVADMHFQHLS